ncbi:MAG: hypothetical protein IH577_04460 [Deltaproteobacteria bacterium]|nr:hypothetical protein [Deltaproteobacteria bacterium]
MRTIVAKLKSVSPYSQSRHYVVDPLPKENKDKYEERTWRERVHATDDGYIYIPPMAFKNCLSEIAKFLGEQIPGKGKATYTKHFEAGVLVMDPIILPIKKTDVSGEWLFVPADGKRGGGNRVNRCFPIIHEWAGELKAYILDETITLEVFEKHLREAGNFIGIGRFRPRNNGYYGRFAVESVKEA